MKGRIRDMGRGFDGTLTVTLSLPPQYADEIHALMQDDISAEIKKWRDKRSKDSNSYAWLLIGKIAERLSPPLSKEEVYLMMLKRYGQGGQVSVRTDRLHDIERELDYHEIIGTGEVNGKAFTHIHMWVGSSKYNSLEMSLFIEGIVSEAKELGIDTDTPSELQRLAEAWERRYG